jgi:D-arabinitol dehydrogenase (NADP+)
MGGGYVKAVVYRAPKKFSIEDIDMPAYGENQVLIRVKACGICKTDLHIHKGEFWAEFPLIPGHEFAGIVEKVGSKVKEFKTGDRVVANNWILCGKCNYCKEDKPLFCENPYAMGVNGPGGFAEYVVVNESMAFHISDNLSFDEAALTEPTACSIHGMDVIDVQCGDDVLIFGAGPTGIILAQLMKNCGAVKVVVAAPTKLKLDIIDKFKIGESILIDRDDRSKNEKIIKERYPQGFDIVVDATGSADIVEQCIKFTKRGAKVVIYGVCDVKDKITLSPYEIFEKELKIIGSYCQTHCFGRAVKYLENKIVKVDMLITHKFGLGDYGDALKIVMGESEKIKVVLNP